MSEPTLMTAEPGILDQRWVCLKCNTSFRVWKVRLHLCSEQHPYGLSCPNCGSGHGLHPAAGETVMLDEYLGEKGTVQ